MVSTAPWPAATPAGVHDTPPPTATRHALHGARLRAAVCAGPFWLLSMASVCAPPPDGAEAERAWNFWLFLPRMLSHPADAPRVPKEVFAARFASGQVGGSLASDGLKALPSRQARRDKVALIQLASLRCACH